MSELEVGLHFQHRWGQEVGLERSALVRKGKKDIGRGKEERGE